MTGSTRAVSKLGAHLTAGAIPLALILLYGLRGSGSYDTITFEQNGLIVWAILGLGLLTGFLPRTRPHRAALALCGALLGYAAWTALSLSWSDSSQLSFQEVVRVVDYLGVAGLLVCVADRRTWRSSLAGAGLGALLICVVALGSRLDPSVFGHDAIDATFHIDRLSVPFGYWNAVAALGAMSAAFALIWSAHDHNPLRAAVALGLLPVATSAVYLSYSRAGIAGVALAAVCSLALSRNRITAALHLITAAAASLIVILTIRSAPAIALGTGQGGAAKVFTALLVTGVVSGAIGAATRLLGTDRRRLPRRVVRYVGIPAGGCAVILVCVGIGAFGPKAWHSFTRPPAATPTGASPTARLDSLSGSRYPVWKSAVRAFDAYPIQGTGAGTFRYWWNEHGSGTEVLKDAHNVWLQNLAELGLPGLALFVAVAVSALRLAWSVRRQANRGRSAGAAAAAGAVFIVFLLHASVDWMWESTTVTVFALACVALLAGRLSEPPRAERAPSPKQHRRSRGHRRGRPMLNADGSLSRPGNRPTWQLESPAARLALRAGLAVAAAGALFLALPALHAQLDIRASQANAAVHNLTRASAYAHAAVRAEPFSADAYQQLGLIQEQQRRYDLAARSMGAAARHGVQNYATWLLLSRIDTERGAISAALKDYRRAHKLAPRASVFTLGPYFKP